MSYIGSTPTSQNFISGTDYFNGTGSQTAFTLTRSVNSVNDVEVVVNNVIQQPSSYTVSGTTLTLSAAPSSGTSNVYVRYLATNQQSFTVGNNTVGYNQLTTDMQSKFAMKNRIINGAMVIDQRNAGAQVTLNGNLFGVDRWGTQASQNSKLTMQQTSGVPAGFSYSLNFTSSSSYSPSASDYFWTYQAIEGYNIADLNWGTANAKTVTLSFWVYSTLTGTFSVALNNGSRSYVSTYTVNSANTWEQKTITVVGDTSGTWNKTNGNGVFVQFDLGCGSTRTTSTTNAWQAGDYQKASGSVSLVSNNAAQINITGVQLEVGSSATGFEYRQYGQELALCQRYYEKSYDYATTLGTINVAGNWTTVSGGAYPRVVSYFKVEKRSTPTMVFYADSDGSVGNVNAWDGGTVRIASAANIFVTNKHTCPEMNYSGTLGNRAAMYYNWTASAEL